MTGEQPEEAGGKQPPHLPALLMVKIKISEPPTCACELIFSMSSRKLCLCQHFIRGQSLHIIKLSKVK